MCAPGVQAGSRAPDGSVSVNADDALGRLSRAETTRSLRRSEKTVAISVPDTWADDIRER